MGLLTKPWRLGCAFLPEQAKKKLDWTLLFLLRSPAGLELLSLFARSEV